MLNTLVRSFFISVFLLKVSSNLRIFFAASGNEFLQVNAKRYIVFSLRNIQRCNNPAGIYLLKVNNSVVLVFLLLTLNIFTPCSSVSIINFERRRSGVFIVNLENISYLFSSVSIVDFEQLSASWVPIITKSDCNFTALAQSGPP